jgi:hypothetical protein
MTPWIDLAFPRLDEEKSPEGKTGVPESHAILVKIDSVMKAWRIASCIPHVTLQSTYAMFQAVMRTGSIH